MSLGSEQEQLAEYIRHQRSAIPERLDEELGHIERRLAVYRNNHFYLLGRALAESFPVTQALLGRNNFDALARGYLCEHPPSSPVLSRWGDSFSEWLQGQPLPQQISWTAQMARFEWAWLQVSVTEVAAALSPEDIQRYSQEELLQCRFRLQPAGCLLHSSVPVRQIWRAHQAGTNNPSLECIDMQQSEYILLMGQDDQVMHWSIDGALYALLMALQQGDTLAQALELAAEKTDDQGLAAAAAFVFNNGILAATEEQ